MHFVKNKGQGREKFMALKLDMEKAYDRIEWPYLFALLHKLGFSPIWINWIRECVTTAMFSVLVNGQSAGYFPSSRGLRQGDPLSPLLFALCTEGFTALIKAAIMNHRLHGVRMNSRCPMVSHLLFADDSFLFLRASQRDDVNLLSLLREYESISGQRVNLMKSAAFFSPNMVQSDQEDLGEFLGIGSIGLQDHYLGLPSLMGSSKIDTFRYVEEKLLSVLAGWKNRCLSSAGKEVLLKSVAMALPVYVMSCFRLPLELIRRLNAHMARFWWGATEGHRRIHWRSWKYLCMSKFYGGLGFREFGCFNQALLAKVAWRILKEPTTLLARIYRGRYNFDSNRFLSVAPGSNPSYGWRSILFGRDLLQQGIRWQVGNGESIRAFEDTWLPTNPPSRPSPKPGALSSHPFVSAFIDPGSKQWNLAALNCFFDNALVAIIRQLPLPQRRLVDDIIWHYEANGLFSVKSAYHLAFSHLRPVPRKTGVSVIDSVLWKWVWTRKLPPKLLFFLWQCLQRVLPTREALATSGMDLLPVCTACGRREETLEHLFFSCHVARRLWRITGFHSRLQTWKLGSFAGFIRHSLYNYNEPDADYFSLQVVCLLWRLWKNRCSVFFDRKQVRIETLASQWRHQVSEADLAILQSNHSASATLGSSANGGLSVHVANGFQYVVTFDGATRLGLLGTSAFVIKDSSGCLLSAQARQWDGVNDALVLEALALRDVLLECQRRNLHSVSVARDAKIIIDKCYARDFHHSKVGILLKEICCLLDDLPDYSLRFIGRSNNREAHSVARHALFMSPRMFKGFDFFSWLRCM
ncbi:unnamed protein product [Linum trigynum]|uniref:Reverse transcriptase domain-containing protein n=1 Tax=Linum trigynum TaxID=586398 RepID=A0AAV2DHB0_9ROSI